MVQLELCSAQDGKKLIEMIADRIETTHNYDAERVRVIVPKISAYYELMNGILQSIKFDEHFKHEIN